MKEWYETFLLIKTLIEHKTLNIFQCCLTNEAKMNKERLKSKWFHRILDQNLLTIINAP